MEQQDMIRMANQIASFFRGYGTDEAKKEISSHLNNFWEPRMREQFFKHLDSGGAGFDPLVLEAAKLVRKPDNHNSNMREPVDHKSGLPMEPKES
ncbi:formate dehydrogenase subunit delta [Aestuariivirga litoralis]|uniref:formate dehydrogenase subunit delta n=1 Tax=Aestuariivirga litoralis TaxID=2650924 RepID=UPI0018C81ACC|nr:formate dehydrogenase subunit delta [Aestuariivirga litoralis]MBG1232245.1 formate dehydrogenase subunit delta [Aestuariivirga litoralis]